MLCRARGVATASRPSVCHVEVSWSVGNIDWNASKIVSCLISVGILLSTSWIYSKGNTRTFIAGMGSRVKATTHTG